MQVYNTWSLHDHISEEIVIMDACSPRINAWGVCIAQMCQEKGSILQRTPDLQHEEVWGVHQLIWMLLVGVYMVWIYSQTKRLINSWGFSLQKGHPELALLCSTKPYFFFQCLSDNQGDGHPYHNGKPDDIMVRWPISSRFWPWHNVLDYHPFEGLDVNFGSMNLAMLI